MNRLRPFYNPRMANYFKRLTGGKSCKECIHYHSGFRVCKKYMFTFVGRGRHVRRLSDANVCRGYRRYL